MSEFRVVCQEGSRLCAMSIHCSREKEGEQLQYSVRSTVSNIRILKIMLGSWKISERSTLNVWKHFKFLCLIIFTPGQWPHNLKCCTCGNGLRSTGQYPRCPSTGVYSCSRDLPNKYHEGFNIELVGYHFKSSLPLPVPRSHSILAIRGKCSHLISLAHSTDNCASSTWGL